MTTTREHFTLKDDDSGEYSIEVDLRESNLHAVQQMRSLGFNRATLRYSF